VTVRTVAVLGAGTMGRGIAAVSVLGGYKTVLQDPSAAALEAAAARVSATLEAGSTTGAVEGAVAVAARERLQLVRSLDEAVKDADLVIEAVPEDIALKTQIFQRLDQIAAPEAVLATNTSSLSITEMAAVTRRAPRVVGMHFFNPVWKMKLLEVVRGLDTSDDAVEIAIEAGKRMGKECVVVRESPGFVTTRINAMIGNEAFYMLQEGVASAEDIDRAMTLGYNHPVGPLRLTDLVGLDVRLAIARYLRDTLSDERFAPPAILERLVAEGKLGNKTGQGFFSWPGE
jgi:3-hydroxybutyryl-CoA dehydrogenase